MNYTHEEVEQMFEENFQNGHKVVRVKEEKEAVLLNDIKQEWLPYMHQEVHLLSPYLHHQRTLFYLFTEELIQLLPQLKEEEIIEEKLLAVVETILLGLDYLTHERFINHPFETRHRDKLANILSEAFEQVKQQPLSTFAHRPSLHKTKLCKKETGVYVTDKREEKKQIYVAIAYKKPKNTMERVKQIGHQLMQIHLKPDTKDVPYEEILKGMTEHGLHGDTLFHLNRVQRALGWLLNSTSWHNNALLGFDEMELHTKLGLR